MAKTIEKSRPQSAPDKWALPARQARSRATQEKILAAAEKIFAEKGYDGARLADIAEVAGCSVGTVYFRFKDKDALFFAIAENFAADARETLEAVLAEDPAKPEQRIRHFVSSTAENFRRHKGMFRAIVERGFEHPLAMKTITTFRDELADALEQQLRHELPERDEFGFAVRVMTQMVYGFLLTGVLNARAPTRIDEARTIRELENAAIAYLLDPPGPR